MLNLGTKTTAYSDEWREAQADDVKYDAISPVCQRVCWCQDFDLFKGMSRTSSCGYGYRSTKYVCPGGRNQKNRKTPQKSCHSLTSSTRDQRRVRYCAAWTHFYASLALHDRSSLWSLCQTSLRIVNHSAGKAYVTVKLFACLFVGCVTNHTQCERATCAVLPLPNRSDVDESLIR